MKATSRQFRDQALAAASVAILALTAATPADAARTRAAFMPVGEAVEPPFGYFDYCQRLDSLCAEFGKAAGVERPAAAANSDYWDMVFQTRDPRSAQRTPETPRVLAELSSAEWREVSRINRRVNRQVRADSDERQFGRKDYWNVPRFRSGRMEGDCEDYVLRKREELIAAGVPEGALSIAIAKTRRAEVHAVLLIATPAGEFVLDNRSSWISRWYDVNYQWERRQIPGSKTWVRASV